jgi:hypothetical protein
MNAFDRVRAMLAEAGQVYRNDPAFGGTGAAHEIDRCAARLEEPLRIALAGTLKAGKSTLLNALVGEELAPTDATECTRIVTWFHHGATPAVRAWHMNGLSAPVPVDRRDGQLHFDVESLDPAGIDRLVVNWPSAELSRQTIIDTPGTASLNSEVSQRTLRLLTPKDGVPGADAVLYLMRMSTAADVNMLSELNRQVGGRSGPLGVIGVVSRADEIGVGRIDAMFSAKEIAARYSAELASSGLCQAVVPVAGLLALTARTLRQSEFKALKALCDVAPDDLQLAMLSADRFCRPDSVLPLDSEVRVRLIERFGLFGVRIALALLQSGSTDSIELSKQLLERSGLTELQSVIDVQFGQRADQLKVHSALNELSRILRQYPTQRVAPIHAAATRMLGDVHGFEELRLLGMLRSRKTSLTEGEQTEVTRLIGGYGTTPDDRLGLDPFETMTSGREAALAAAHRWRNRSANPLNDSFTARVCRAGSRSAEGIVADLSASRVADHSSRRH